jgi:mono/diheme cytochrome c family protein
MQRLLAMLAAAGLFSALADAEGGSINRGRYLTEEVAKCQECHTQRLATGELDRSVWLKGATSSGNSSITAPDITSGGVLWKRWREDGMLRFLETGMNVHGAGAAVPMPAYRLRHDDAEAIVAYLKSLR